MILSLYRLVGAGAALGLFVVEPVEGMAANQPDAGTQGKWVYERHCAACHGMTGEGNGPASVWLYPKPRNFSAGLFKIKSTPAQALPTDDDLLRSVIRGLPGSSMPGFSYLTDAELREVVRYVKQLTTTRDGAGQPVDRFDQAKANGTLAAAVEVPSEPPITVQELTLGRDTYQKMQCFLCHGQTGAGDGTQVSTLKDESGLPIRPRDFNTGLFRGGSTGRDLYLRIHNGLPGTPMVPYGNDVLKPDARWALVHYVQSLRRTDVAVNDLLAPEDGLIRIQRVGKVPTHPMDALWDTQDPVRVPLNPLWPEPHQVYAVAVSAFSDGQRLAVLLRWRCDVPQRSAIRVQDFQDAAAIQFSLSGRYGFVAMGDKDNPVNLWQWKAGWQAEVDQVRSPDEREPYNSMHVDTYFQADRHFATARDAGNVVSQPHTSSVEDANARGFGSFTSQPLAQQNVIGKGVWHDGFWNVVFVRTLKSRDPEDVRFQAGKTVPVAFAIWSGEQRDRNGRKMISNWFQLVFDTPRSVTTKR